MRQAYSCLQEKTPESRCCVAKCHPQSRVFQFILPLLICISASLSSSRANIYALVWPPPDGNDPLSSGGGQSNSGLSTGVSPVVASTPTARSFQYAAPLHSGQEGGGGVENPVASSRGPQVGTQEQFDQEPNPVLLSAPHTPLQVHQEYPPARLLLRAARAFSPLVVLERPHHDSPCSDSASSVSRETRYKTRGTS